MCFARNGETSFDEWIDGPFIHTLAASNVRLPTATYSDPTTDGITWRLWELCLSLFTTLRPLIVDATITNDASTIFHGEDLLATLFVWGDGFRNGQLDLVLQDSDDLQSTVLADLGAIAVILKIRLYRLARFAREEERADALHQIRELDILLEKAETIYKDDGLNFKGGHNNGDSDLNGLESREENCAEELSVIAKDLGEHIFSLMELVPSMENTLAQIKGKFTAPNRKDFTVSKPAGPYVLRVRDKFGKADLKLIERLGQANWERHTKITERLDEDAEIYNNVTQGIDEAKSIFTPSSLFHDSGLGRSSRAIHSNKVALRCSSFASRPRASGRLRVPTTPSEVQKGIPFTCNICGHVLHNVKSRKDWKVHIFADLHPYMCTFPSCQDEFVTFPTRRSWADHELSYHRVEKHWNCPRCLDELKSINSWKEHLAHEHDITYSGSTYLDAIEIAENTIPQPYETQQCPLCLEVPGHSQKNFINHVGEHLEEISLAALPRKLMTSSETDSMSSTHTANAGAHQLKGDENESVSSLMLSPSPKVAHCRLMYSKQLEEPENRTLLIQDQRPEKCPLQTCGKSFDRKFVKNRHTLTHFKGTLVCRFCPQFGSAGLQQFNRVDMFKKHLVERHGVRVGRNHSQQRKCPGRATVASVLCAVCHHIFNDAQTMYKHLDDCILHHIERRYAGQSSRRNVSYSKSSARLTGHDISEISGTRALSNTVTVEPSSQKSLVRSRLWSHDIPLGLDALYHCPWETSEHCSHAPVSLRRELHKCIDEHRRPYRCINRLCGDVRFSSQARLRRHERKAQLLHMSCYEYKTYICPHKGCAETDASGIYMKTSELREHITQHHKNSSNLPYWSDSSSSSQSPPPIDPLNISRNSTYWDEWLHNDFDQSEFQTVEGRDHDCLDFPVTTGAQDPSQITMTSNEKITPPQNVSSPPSFDPKSFAFENPNAHNMNQSASKFSTWPAHGSLFDTLEDNFISHESNFNYSEPLDNLSFPPMSSTQASLPAFSALSMTTDPVLDPMLDPMVQFGGTALPHTSLMNELRADPGTMLNSASPLSVSLIHQQPVKRIRSAEIPPSDSINVYHSLGIQGHAEVPRKTRNIASIQERQSSRKTGIQEESILMTGDVYGVSDTESNLPKKKKRRSGLHGSRPGSRDYGSAAQNFFVKEPSQEMSFEPLSQHRLREAPEHQCPRCRRTYKTEEKLSHHIQNHRHTYQCTHAGCYLTFDPLKDFKRHIETHNRQRGRFFCKFKDCEDATKGFSREDNLARHVRLCHGRDDEYSEGGNFKVD